MVKAYHWPSRASENHSLVHIFPVLRNKNVLRKKDGQTGSEEGGCEVKEKKGRQEKKIWWVRGRPHQPQSAERFLFSG